MLDSITATSSTGWFGRIRESIKGVLFGLLLFVVSFPVLWLNEKNSAETIAGLNQLVREAFTVESGSVNPKFEGKPVHMSGRAETDEVLNDGRFGVTANAIKLVREVEMYQWKENEKTETRKKFGGGEKMVTTYSYEKVWSTKLINSSSFNQQGQTGHENPPMSYQSATIQAKGVSLGAFKLNPFLIGQMDDREPLALDDAQRRQLPADMRAKLKDDGPGYYQGTPSAPQIGDFRIQFQIVKPATVSIIARQIGNSFEKYVSKNGKSFGLLEMGARSKENVVHAAQDRNSNRTWLIRLVGCLVMFVGLLLILSPFSVLADLLPLVGDVVGAGTALISALVAVSFSLMTIAFAWISYRPLLGIPLATAAVGLIVFVFLRLGSQRKARTGKETLPAPKMRERPAPPSDSHSPLPTIPQPVNELKFSCPTCGQHVQCEAGYGGMEIACPACVTKMLVPAAAVIPGALAGNSNACPECKTLLATGTGICTHCGFNLQNGEWFQMHTASQPALSESERQKSQSVGFATSSRWRKSALVAFAVTVTTVFVTVGSVVYLKHSFKSQTTAAGESKLLAAESSTKPLRGMDQGVSAKERLNKGGNREIAVAGTQEGFASPMEVFEYMKTAEVGTDLATLLPEDRPFAAYTGVLMARMIVAIQSDPNQQKDAEQDFTAIIEKYHLADRLEFTDTEDEAKIAELAAKAFTDVDLKAFMTDVSAFMEKHSSISDAAAEPRVVAMKDLKINGKEARATIVSSDATEQLMVFVQSNGRWFLSLRLTSE